MQRKKEGFFSRVLFNFFQIVLENDAQRLGLAMWRYSVLRKPVPKLRDGAE